MVMELLGTSLEDLFQFCNRRFSLKTVCMLAEQLITRIEFMHTQNFLHRDIKPDNFLMGVNNKKATVYMIDFGLSKRYRDAKTGEHISYRDGKSLTGTARYASVNCHCGVEQARRDDLESIGYILLYFLKGQLPWQGLAGKNKDEKYDKIREKKCQTTVEQLTQGVPEEFMKFINYCRDLKFDEKPDYNFLRGLLQTIMKRHSYEYDGQFDWVLKKDGKDDQLRALLQNGEAGKFTHVPMLKTQGQEERKEVQKPGQKPVPVQAKVIPNYNEFANAPQYKNPKAKVNPGFAQTGQTK